MATRLFYFADDDVRKLRALIGDVESQKNFGGGHFLGGRSTSRGRQLPPEGMRIGKVAGVSAAEGTSDLVLYDVETYSGVSMAPFGVGLAPWMRAVPASDTETVLTAAAVGALCVYWVGAMVTDPQVGREVHLICVQGEGLAVRDCAAPRPGGPAVDWGAVDVLTRKMEQFERRLRGVEGGGLALQGVTDG